MRKFMKKLAMILISAVAIALFGRVAYLILFAPSPDAASLDHEFRQAAYSITWAIQLGYLAWLGLKWRSQKRDAERAGVPQDAGKSSTH
jgi:hypothetical protein